MYCLYQTIPTPKGYCKVMSRNTYGEYTVWTCHNKSAHAETYFTDDLEDAINTAHAIVTALNK